MRREKLNNGTYQFVYINPSSMAIMDSIYDFVCRLLQPWSLLAVTVLVLAMAHVKGGRKKTLPPGPRRLPVVGCLPKLKGAEMFYVKLNELRELHGDVMYLTLGAVKMLVVFGHDKVKSVLGEKAEQFKFRPTWLVEIKTMDLTKGIVWSNGLDNQHMRAFALPALHPGIGSQTLEQRVQEESKMAVKEMAEGTTESAHLRELFYRAICNINCGVIFGSRFEYTDPEFVELMDVMERLLQRQGIKNPLNFFPVLQKLPQGKKVKESLELLGRIKHLIHNHVEKSRETFDGNNPGSLIDLFLQRQGQDQTEEYSVTEDNICHITRDLFVAGSENVAIGILWLIGYMTKYPDVQEKCRKFITQNIGDKQTAGKEDMDKVPYVYATLNEVLRLANIAPLSVPHATVEEVEFDGFQIPKDTMVLTHLESVHLDPKHWEEPEQFNPDRFLDENGHFVKKEAFYPFSIGPRYCLAMKLAETELFIMFCSLLQHFRFETLEEGTPLLKHTQPGAFVEPAPFKINCRRNSET